MQSKTSWAPSATAFLSLALPLSTHAQDGPAPIEKLVVTATRTERPSTTVPYTINVLDSDYLVNRHQVRTVPEALSEVPGILVQKTAHGQGSPYIRGFTGFRTLFLVDGIRLNNSTFRDGPNQYWNTVDPLSISRLEIVKGPSSVLYGSDAVGGTVNALLVSPLMTPDQDGPNYRVLYRYADAENASVGRVQVGYKRGNASFVAGYSLKDFGDLESGGGPLPKTGYNESDADLRVEYALSDTQRLVFAHQQLSQDDAWRTHQTIYAVSFAGSTVGSELERILYQDRDLTYLQYHADSMDGFVDALHVSVSRQSQEESRRRIRSNLRLDLQGADVDTTGFSIQAESFAATGQWTYGLEYYHDSVSSFRVDYNADGSLRGVSVQGPVADDASYDLLGVYAERQLPLGERWELIGGVRYTEARLDANRVADPVNGGVMQLADDWSDGVGSLRLRYSLNEGSQIYGGISQGFRAPNLSDMTRLDTARTNEIETPVRSLDPEKFVSYEIGYRLAASRASAQIAFYYTDVDDLIVRTPTGAIVDGSLEVTKKNSSGGFTKGLELDGTWDFSDRLSLLGGFAWMDGEIDTYPTSDPMLVREPIDRLMPITTLVGLRWNAASGRNWVESTVVHAEDADELSTRDQGDTSRIPPGGTPGYTVLNLRSGWELNRTLTLSAAVTNLTDQNYRVHGSGLNEAGRNFIVTLDARFQ